MSNSMFARSKFSWKPMDSAPKDKPVLVKLDDGRMTTARWVPEERHHGKDARREWWYTTGGYWELVVRGHCPCNDVDDRVEPVEWMPLP